MVLAYGVEAIRGLLKRSKDVYRVPLLRVLRECIINLGERCIKDGEIE